MLVFCSKKPNMVIETIAASHATPVVIHHVLSLVEWCMTPCTLDAPLRWRPFAYKEKHVKPLTHDDVIKWKHFPRYWPFVSGIHRSPKDSPHTGQWRGALIFSLICAWTNGWTNETPVIWDAIAPIMLLLQCFTSLIMAFIKNQAISENINDPFLKIEYSEHTCSLPIRWVIKFKKSRLNLNLCGRMCP